MAKCKCGSTFDRFRKVSKKPSGKGYKYKIVCLDCGYEWWSTSHLYYSVPDISESEKRSISR